MVNDRVEKQAKKIFARIAVNIYCPDCGAMLVFKDYPKDKQSFYCEIEGCSSFGINYKAPLVELSTID